MRRNGVVIASLLGIVVHAIVSVVLAGILLSAAYGFGADAGIGSRDDLYRLGDSPRFGFYGLALSGFADLVLTLVLLAWERSRRWAWATPWVFIGVSVLICLAAIAGFQTPEPLTGG